METERVQSSWPAFRPHSKLSFFKDVLTSIIFLSIRLFSFVLKLKMDISRSRDVTNLMFQLLFWCFWWTVLVFFFFQATCPSQIWPLKLWSIPHRLIFLFLYLFFRPWAELQQETLISLSLSPSTTRSPPVGLSAFITSSPTNRYFLHKGKTHSTDEQTDNNEHGLRDFIVTVLQTIKHE